MGKEAVEYDTADSLIEKAGYYLDHPAKARAIAKTGHARTLRDHSYAVRTGQLAAILERYQ